MREWMVTEKIASPEEIDEIEKLAKAEAKKSRETAWKLFIDDIKNEQQEALDLIGKVANSSSRKARIEEISGELRKALNPEKADVMRASRKALRLSKNNQTQEWKNLQNWIGDKSAQFQRQYSSLLYSESANSALKVETTEAVYNENSKLVDGREVLNACFDQIFEHHPTVFAIGEDVGKIGDVNQGFAGLQEKYGELRITDTGIREATIVGQGIGSALRGLRPIVEIQYLDYLLYAIQTLSDDLATLQYRTYGGQKAPLIVRTRGHRLEGVWHSGSPMGMILNSLRGMMVLVPRNMTQAAGFYNTLIQSDDPALVIESLNGYRLKERIPENLQDFKLALGIPEILKEGTDATLVMYGSTCRIVSEAANQLELEGISVEVIDAQTLIPFDKNQIILNSLKKTNRLVIVDEDVQGGASGFILQQVLERDGGYFYLDSKPVTITGKDHRPAYGSDGDYFSKPNVEDIVEQVLELMSETDPEKYRNLK